MNTAAMLDDQGHRVTMAYSGKEALKILRSGEAFDLLITDQGMPGMTGAELIDTVRAERPDLPDRAGDGLRRTASRHGARRAAAAEAFHAGPASGDREAGRAGRERHRRRLSDGSRPAWPRRRPKKPVRSGVPDGPG